MSDTSENKRLSPEDPVDEATLVALARLRDVRLTLGAQLMDLELQKIQLLSSVKRIDEQNQRMFDEILVSRGLPPGTAVELDGPSGRLKVIRPEPAEAPATPKETP